MPNLKAKILVVCIGAIAISLFLVSSYAPRLLNLASPSSADANRQAITPSPTPPPALSNHSQSSLQSKSKLLAQSTPALDPREKEATDQLKLRFNSGNFVGTVKYADQLFKTKNWNQDFTSWLNSQMPQFLTSAGWQLLRLGDCEAAKSYFQRSASYRNLPETSKGMAYCYFREGALGDAEFEIRRFQRERPLDNEMVLLYSDLLESDGRFEEAVGVLESSTNIVASSDDSAEISGRLAAMRARAKESQQQLVTAGANFKIRYQVGLHEEIVPVVVSALEVALDEYLTEYAFQPPSQPIEVVLYSSDRFQDAVVKGPEWAAGIFDGRIRVPLSPSYSPSQKDHLEAVLRHELVHALLAEKSDRRPLPVWFEEGLAQRLSCGDKCPPFQFPIKLGVFLKPSFLEQPFIGLDNVGAQEAYRQSLLLILTLEQKSESADVLRQVIQGITKQSDITSDAILAPSGTKFSVLREIAEKNWFQRNPMVAIGGGR